MRNDIAKKLVERPRFGGDGKANLRSDRRKGKNPEKWDDLPKKESMKFPNIRYYSGKYLNEYFPPLKGFLRKNVGRPWNKVNSEIREHLRPSSTTQKHVLDHLYRDFVELTPMWIDGVPHRSDLGYGGEFMPLSPGEFYVDPHGLLKAFKPKKGYRGRRFRRRPSAHDPRKVINDFEEYRQILGVWFWVRYTHLRFGHSGYDVVLRKEFKVGPYGCMELSGAHGNATHAGEIVPGCVRLAVEKRQLSKKTIRDEGLDKL